MPLSKDDIGNHISGQFNEDLQALHAHVLEMSHLVQVQISDATTALLTGNTDLAASVIRRGVEANAREIDLDGECTRILVKRQPAASDLRLIFAVIKTVTDLARIGDQAERVARSAMEHADDAKRHRSTSLKRMATLALALLNQSVDAFARMDSVAALDIARLDVELDQEYETIMRELVTCMMEDPRLISWALNMAWAARALERIGDHAKNIAEYVIYMVEGKDVRHTRLEEREQTVLGQD
jgi:phosphate transport system protein